MSILVIFCVLGTFLYALSTNDPYYELGLTLVMARKTKKEQN